jgi:nitrous oxidase accessory protein NosD
LLIGFALNSFPGFSQLYDDCAHQEGSLVFEVIKEPTESFIPFCTEIYFQITVCSYSDQSQDVTVEIPIPTSSLDVVDAGSFSLTGNDLIRTISFPPADGQVCEILYYTAVINTGAGTPFSVDADATFDTEDCETSFTIAPSSPQYIGSPSSPTNLGDIIYTGQGTPPTGKVWDTSSDCGIAAGEIYVVQGEIVVDDGTSYCFSASEIRFESRGKITIEDGGFLVIPGEAITNGGTTVGGCTTMWPGITVEPGGFLWILDTRVQDAENALTLEDGSNSYIRDNEFEDNRVSIYVPESGDGSIQNVKTFLSSNTIQGTGRMKATFPAQTTEVAEIPFAGIVLNDLAGLTITGSSNGSNYSNSHELNNMANGIIGRNASFSVNNTYIHDMKEPEESSDYLFSSRGITVLEGSHLIAKGYGQNGLTSIEACETGIYGDKSRLEVGGQVMEEVETGIFLTQSPSMNHQIHNNDISASLYGMELLFNAPLPFKSRIEDNIITIDGEEPNSAGIYAAEPGDYSLKGWNIVDNLINLRKGEYGIRYQNGFVALIRQNTVDFSFGSDNSGDRGFVLENMGLSSINCNLASGPEPIGLSETKGVEIISSFGLNVLCNEAENTTTGIHFLGMSPFTRLRGNTFGEHFEGLKLGENINGLKDASIGAQAHNGNLWTGNYSGDALGAVHFGNLEQVDQSQFLLYQNNINTEPDLLPKYETPNASGADWFKVITSGSGSYYQCDLGPLCEDGIAGSHLFPLGLDKFVTDIRDDSLSIEGHTEGLRWDSRRNLYRALDIYPSAKTNYPSLDTFYRQMDTTAIGELSHLENRWVALFDSTSQINQHLEEGEEVVRELLVDLAELDSLLFDPPSYSDSLTWDSLKTLKLDTLLAQREQMSLLRDSFLSIQNDTLEVLRSDLSSIYTIDSTAQNLISIMDINLAEKVNDTLTSAQVITLNTIAGLCPLSGGDAVFWARAMIGNGRIYDDLSLCTLAGGSGKQKEEDAGYARHLQVFPNPTESTVWVSLPSEEYQTLSIFNGNGELIQSMEIHQDQIRLHLGDLTPGLYIVQARNDKGDSLQAKIIITAQ